VSTRGFEGATAVVTGASGGLGRACAHALATAGAAVILVSRSAGALARLAVEIGERGGRASTAPCDLTDPAEVDETFERLPVPDVVVGCAGGNRPKPFLDLDYEDLDWSWRVNVVGALLAARAAARRMVGAGREGAIVTVTSQMGHVGGEDRVAYCAAKHAVEGASKAMALELAPHGIRVNTVAPTFVETAMTRPFLADGDFRAAVLERIPLGRLGTPDEVAAAVLFAASPGATLMTGASLLVDGGWTAR
jgi:NAD(P)-dependent dehydrogenase (short-subunit alcohol dehydrogenase family)